MKEKLKQYNLLIINILFILVLESILKVFIFNNFFQFQTLYMVIFSIIIGLILTLLSTFFSSKVNKIISIILWIIITFLFISQVIYYCYYGSIYSFYSLTHGGQVLEFFDSIRSVIMHNFIIILLLIIPLILLIVLSNKLNYDEYRIKTFLIIGIAIIIIYSSNIIGIKLNKSDDIYSSKNLYFSVNDLYLSVNSFGLLTTMRLDLKRFIFGFEEVILDNDEKEKDDLEEEIDYNMLEIDFQTLIDKETNDTISNIHKYFNNISPTPKNDYTGMFEGKNLIVFVAEAFSPIAINPIYTPTLYKLYNEGFQFTNFYTPVYYVSTSDGEYTSLTSLLPKTSSWSMTESSKNYLPFVYGNIFKNEGYITKAYHNGSYTYYNRHLSLPNMGYEYIGCGNGLNIQCRKWPQSDLEMIDATIDDYINEDKFMTYYMTVSGHLNYNFYGNVIALKNKKYVDDMNASSAIKAYMATQIELDKALEKLISSLDEAGKLDDTVIALSSDHYPYGLTNAQILEYVDYIDDIKFDLHRNNFLLWNSEIEEPIVNDKYVYSIDILPTILNLFGLDYDSRLMMGTDILHEDEGLVIFNDRSWITEKGKYNATTKTFTSFVDGIDDDYIEKINLRVYNKMVMSTLILDNDYYRKIFVE